MKGYRRIVLGWAGASLWVEMKLKSFSWYYMQRGGFNTQARKEFGWYYINTNYTMEEHEVM